MELALVALMGGVVSPAAGDEFVLWRQGRAVYQNPRLKWWFAYGR